MLYAPITREQFLHLMPKGGIIAEIGSYRGDFAQAIVDTVQPAHLHLIDPWQFQDQANYVADISNVSDEQHEDNHRFVQDRFKDEIKSGQVVLHRDFSVNAASGFDDGYFDWVYVDGMHTYDAVKADLETYQAKIKPDGLILGHDYVDHEILGVIPAVNDFVRETDFEIIAMTGEPAHSFALSRNVNSEITCDMAARIIHNVPNIFEIRNPIDNRFLHKEVTFPEGTVRTFPSF